MSVAFELIENSSLILALAFIRWFIVSRWPPGHTYATLSTGVLIGLTAVAAMSLAFKLSEDAIFDSRSVVLAVGAIFGGPVVAAISTVVAATYRLLVVGGDGAFVGVCVIATSSAIGLIFHFKLGQKLTRIRPATFLILGVVVHASALAWFTLLPDPYIETIFHRLALPYIAILSAMTVALGILFREIERSRFFLGSLREQKSRLQHFFDSTAIAMLEEDITAVYRQLETLRNSGIENLQRHLESHPDLISELLKGVTIVRVNPAARDLFGVSTDHELKTDIQNFFAPGSERVFVASLLALWNSDTWFQSEVTYRRKDGILVPCIISFPVPRNAAQAAHTPVSIVDVSEQKQNELLIDQERRHLQEILWGTDAGTWEWNVVTGETVFNQRWADIVGYSLAELEPISIRTWEELAHPDDLKESEVLLNEVLSGSKDFYQAEIRMRHRTGRWVWVLDRGRVVERDSAGYPVRMSGTHMDISARKQAEQKALHVTDALEALLRCHRNILLAGNEHELYKLTAETLANERAYSLVWFGVPEQDSKRRVNPITSAGEAKAYLDGLEVLWSSDVLGRGPIGSAVRSGEVQTIPDISRHKDFAPWLARAEKSGFKSVIAAPIKVSDTVVSVLTIYSSLNNAFVDQELELVSGFAESLGLAITAFRLQEKNELLGSELEQAALGAVGAIAATIEQRDPYTAGHQVSVANLCVAIGRKLGWDDAKLEGLRLGAMIHDIGKIHVPAEILNQPGKLSEPEFEIIKTHPKVGYDILKSTKFAWPIQDMIYQHHERLDGSGYPQGLHGDLIIDEAKVLAVADVVDAITSHRPYRPGRGLDEALAEIQKNRGTHYAANVVDACLEVIEEEHLSWQVDATTQS